MSFLERSRMRGIAGGNNTFHHPKCRHARPEWGWVTKAGAQFARCCMFDFYADEQADDHQRQIARNAIEALDNCIRAGWIAEELGEAAKRDVQELLKERLAARWDHGQNLAASSSPASSGTSAEGEGS